MALCSKRRPACCPASCHALNLAEKGGMRNWENPRQGEGVSTEAELYTHNYIPLNEDIKKPLAAAFISINRHALRTASVCHLCGDRNSTIAIHRRPGSTTNMYHRRDAK